LHVFISEVAHPHHLELWLLLAAGVNGDLFLFILFPVAVLRSLQLLFFFFFFFRLIRVEGSLCAPLLLLLGLLSLERRHLPSFLLELLPSPDGSLFTVLFEDLVLLA